MATLMEKDVLIEKTSSITFNNTEQQGRKSFGCTVFSWIIRKPNVQVPHLKSISSPGRPAHHVHVRRFSKINHNAQLECTRGTDQGIHEAGEATASATVMVRLGSASRRPSRA